MLSVCGSKKLVKFSRKKGYCFENKYIYRRYLYHKYDFNFKKVYFSKLSCLYIFSCNYNSRSPNAAKIGIAGGDGFINSVLRPYVEQFSAKSPDWQTYVKFLIIPFGE